MSAKSKIANLTAEVERLKKELSDHHDQWFYLHCHPEDAREVAAEMIGLATYERDRFGHIVKPGNGA